MGIGRWSSTGRLKLDAMGSAKPGRPQMNAALRASATLLAARTLHTSAASSGLSSSGGSSPVSPCSPCSHTVPLDCHGMRTQKFLSLVLSSFLHYDLLVSYLAEAGDDAVQDDAEQVAAGFTGGSSSEMPCHLFNATECLQPGEREPQTRVAPCQWGCWLSFRCSSPEGLPAIRRAVEDVFIVQSALLLQAAASVVS